MTGTVSSFAPAKINLALHVTGRREDGYHLLSSLVVFADIGDRVSAAPGDGLSLRVTGPRRAGVPENASNLVLKAAALLGGDRGAALTLDKHLPAASGIGGGSSDAAAALRVLARLWDVPLPDAAAVLALGADVPVCLAPRPVVMEGIGERLRPVPELPSLAIVLVNPGLEVATPAVFRDLERRDGTPLDSVPGGTSAAEFAAWLATQRNDLEAPARALAPEIGTVLATLGGTSGCLLARMSGSGATCFGLYADGESAAEGARAVQVAQPGWWVASGRVLAADDQSTRATT